MPVEKVESFPRTSRRLGAPPSLKKYKVHQNAPFKKQNSKIFSTDGPRENVFPGLRCGSRRPCINQSASKPVSQLLISLLSVTLPLCLYCSVVLHKPQKPYTGFNFRFLPSFFTKVFLQCESSVDSFAVKGCKDN